MAKTPNFEEITNSITQADIDKFLRTAGPEDFREQVRSAPDQLTRMRFVAGYLIRTNQITPERLGHTARKSGAASASAAKPKQARQRAAARKSAAAAGGPDHV